MVINLPFLSSAVIEGMSRNEIFNTYSVPPKNVALVLGAAAYNPNSLSPILQDRMDTAIQLYRKGKVKKLILSGAVNEVVAMATYAIKQGIPQSYILGDQNGYNTFASISDIANDYHDIIVVTQRYHLPRSLFYAKKLGIDAVGVVADKRKYTKINKFKRRERIAQVKAFIDMYLLSWIMPNKKLMEFNKKIDELG